MPRHQAENIGPHGDYVPRREALRILEVKPQTLYSYVSRGLIRRLDNPQGRISYYNRQDIERRKARSVARSGHGPAAASAIHWGEPLLSTAVTEITDQGPRYRDRLATELARDDVPFEAVAGYLWTGRLAKKTMWRVATEKSAVADELCKIARPHPEMHIRQLFTEIAWLGGMTGRTERYSAAAEISLSSKLLQDMTAAFGFLGPQRSFVDLQPGERIARGLARALGIAPHPARLYALNAALVLVADHELTPATFAARIAASTGSDLYSCIAAAIQVQFGSAQGLRCDRIERRLDLTARSCNDRPDAVLRNARVPHELGVPIYPKGDPRAKMLLELALDIWASSEGPIGATIGEAVSHDRFTLDEGLVVLCRVLGVQRQVAGGLLALGRTAGWIAHVLEQRQEPFVIRPRGKFVPGPAG